MTAVSLDLDRQLGYPGLYLVPRTDGYREGACRAAPK